MGIYEDSLEYHSKGRPGKIEVVPTKPTSTQRELSLAYSPGVAGPCRAIAENPLDVEPRGVVRSPLPLPVFPVNVKLVALAPPPC